MRGQRSFAGPDAPPSPREPRALLLPGAPGDGLPEQMPFPDQGCDLHPRCLTCPLPRCKYDDPAATRRDLVLARDEQIRRLRQAEGLSIAALAQRYGLSRRSIFRILRQGAK